MFPKSKEHISLTHGEDEVEESEEIVRSKEGGHMPDIEMLQGVSSNQCYMVLSVYVFRLTWKLLK